MRNAFPPTAPTHLLFFFFFFHSQPRALPPTMVMSNAFPPRKPPRGEETSRAARAERRRSVPGAADRTMTSCTRIPPFPLSAANPLLEEAKAALAQPLLSPEALDSLYCACTSLRRWIHANPEPGFEEKKTNALLRNMLTTLADIPESAFSDCAGTGLVVDMMGEGDLMGAAGAKVRTIALRADMDALRMTEGNNGLPYRSANEGVAHLCGHDGHMASLVGAAALLRRRLSRVPRDCKVRLLFQPAEEGPGGAAPMVQGGCMQGVDEVYGYHNWPSWPLGHLKVTPGPIMAHPSSFEIVITGKGGHGSQPQFAVDPVP